MDIRQGDAYTWEVTLKDENGSSWAKATKVYKKVNGAWVQQTYLSTVFSTGVNYKRG